MICINKKYRYLGREGETISPPPQFLSSYSHVMAQGIIKKKVEEKGFGFIAVEGSDDIFFHMSACNGQFNNLPEGTAVQFDTEESPKGKRAVNVAVLATVL